MMTYQQLLLSLKKWIIFGKFTGCKDQQGTPIYPYGISKVSCTSYGLATCGKFFYWIDYLFY